MAKKATKKPKKKTSKKLWCVSFKHDEMESETIYHVHAKSHEDAIEIATAEFIDNTEIYYDPEVFAEDLDNGDLDIIGFEVKKSEILK